MRFGDRGNRIPFPDNVDLIGGFHRYEGGSCLFRFHFRTANIHCCFRDLRLYFERFVDHNDIFLCGDIFQCVDRSFCGDCILTADGGLFRGRNVSTVGQREFGMTCAASCTQKRSGTCGDPEICVPACEAERFHKIKPPKSCWVILKNCYPIF